MHVMLNRQTNKMLPFNVSSFPSSSQQNSNQNIPQHQWNQNLPQQMPWAVNVPPYQSLMTFGSDCFQNYQQISPTTSTNSTNFNQLYGSNMQSNRPSTSSRSFLNAMHHKRKADTSINSPVKQYITEEKMAAHMSRLHITSETPINTDEIEGCEKPEEREKRLFICEEMRKLQTESVIPAALLKRNKAPVVIDRHASVDNSKLKLSLRIDKIETPVSYRLERPCMAVMLWKPPEKNGETFIDHLKTRINEEHDKKQNEEKRGVTPLQTKNFSDSDYFTGESTDITTPELDEMDMDL